MKKSIFTTIVCLTTLFSSAQKITADFNDVSTKKVKGSIDIYISQSGEQFSVGDTISLGKAMNETFANVRQNAGTAFYPVDNSAAGSEAVIKKIKAQGKVAYLNTKAPNGFVYGLKINLEAALSTGELKSKQPTSTEALQQLKDEKDKLDFGLINQEEFEKRKAELIKFIN
jgi:hypothetical protein